jgi:hypothetical protein
MRGGETEMIIEDAIERFSNFDDYSAAEAKWSDIVDALKELRERRASDLPPCLKYRNNTNQRQLAHVLEELIEVKEEVDEMQNADKPDKFEAARLRAGLETIDIIQSCVTFLHNLGFDGPARRELRKQVIAKNSAPDRDYYREVNDE